MDASDTDLMLAYQSGGYEAFEILYRRHKGPLLRYFQRQLSSCQGVAEELFQDVWMKVVRARESYRPDATFKTWLYTIARNRLFDHYRSTQRAPWREMVEEPETLSSTSDPQQETVTNQQLQRLLALVTQLPQEQREVFLLREEAGFTLPEIAELTSCTVEAAKSRLRYAVKRLKQGLEAYCDA